MSYSLFTRQAPARVRCGTPGISWGLAQVRVKRLVFVGCGGDGVSPRMRYQALSFDQLNSIVAHTLTALRSPHLWLCARVCHIKSPEFIGIWLPSMLQVDANWPILVPI